MTPPEAYIALGYKHPGMRGGYLSQYTRDEIGELIEQMEREIETMRKEDKPRETLGEHNGH
jgi:hypothetical protein